MYVYIYEKKDLHKRKNGSTFTCSTQAAPVMTHYVCVCVCVCVCIYICIYICVSMYININIHTYIYGNRGLHVCKRPTFMKIEIYIYAQHSRVAVGDNASL